MFSTWQGDFGNDDSVVEGHSPYTKVLVEKCLFEPGKTSIEVQHAAEVTLKPHKLVPRWHGINGGKVMEMVLFPKRQTQLGVPMQIDGCTAEQQ